MSKTAAHEHRAALREPVLLGINRLVVAPMAATYKTPSVYIEEIPSGANG